MKAFFFHDHYFYNKNEVVYSNGGLPYESLNYYAKIFGELTVISRLGLINSENSLVNFTVANGPNVNFKLVPGFSSPLSFLFKRRFLYNFILDNTKNADLFIIRLPSQIGFVALSLALKYKIKFAVEVVGCPAESYRFSGSLIGKISYPIFRYLMQQALFRSKYAIYVTDKHLQQLYPSPGYSVGCSDVSLKSKDNIYLNSKNYDIKLLGKIGLIGNFSTNYKGIDTAIWAVKYLKDRGVYVSLHILGKGDPARYSELCHKLGISDNVFFDGSLPSGDAVINWLSTLNLYIQPSLTEGLPRALVEAMSIGLPCIASRVGGIPDLLSDDFLIERRDYKDLAVKISSLLGDEKCLISASKKNYDTSKRYDSKLLNTKREKFWFRFKEFVKN